MSVVLKAPPRAQTAQTVLRLPVDDLTRLRLHREQTGITNSEVVRQALKYYFAIEELSGKERLGIVDAGSGALLRFLTIGG